MFITESIDLWVIFEVVQRFMFVVIIQNYLFRQIYLNSSFPPDRFVFSSSPGNSGFYILTHQFSMPKKFKMYCQNLHLGLQIDFLSGIISQICLINSYIDTWLG